MPIERCFKARWSDIRAIWNSFKRHLPSSRRKQLEADEPATILELINAETDPVYRMPPELVLMVHERLPMPDIMSLKLTS
jgi:hypothetical protein